MVVGNKILTTKKKNFDFLVALRRCSSGCIALNLTHTTPLELLVLKREGYNVMVLPVKYFGYSLFCFALLQEYAGGARMS